MKRPDYFILGSLNWSGGDLPQFHEFQTLMSMTHSAVSGLRSALLLYKHVKSLQEYHLQEITERTANRETSRETFQDISGWTHVAAHGAVDALTRFNDTLAELEKWQLQNHEIEFPVPSFTVQARAAFDSAFPSFKNIRHALAHHTEITLKPEDHVYKGRINGPVTTSRGRTFVSDTLIGDTLTTMRRGQLLTVEVSESSYLKLLEIYQHLLKSAGSHDIRQERD